MGGCAAINCSNHSRNGFKMVRFPRDKQRRKLWIKNIRRNDWEPGLQAQICIHHFDDSQFESLCKDKKKLRHTAVPTIFNLPTAPSQDVSDRRKGVECPKSNTILKKKYEEMPSYCSAYLCSNSSDKVECNKKKISFHTFPLKNELLLQFWLIQMKRDNFIPNASSKLCSEHFEEDCFYYQKGTEKRLLQADAVPTKFKFTEDENELNMRTFPTVMHIKNFKKRRLSDEHDESSLENQDIAVETVTARSTVDLDLSTSSPIVSSSPIFVYKKNAEVQTKMDGISALLIENTVLQNEIVELKTKVHRLTFSAETITDPSLMKSLTGFSIDLLKAVCSLLSIERQLNPSFNLNPFNQFFLFLVYLRTGISQLFISLLFKTSQTSVSRICYNMSHFLYDKVKSINIWPTRECITKRTAPAFTKNYPNCRVILECIEFPIQRPSNPKTQQLTFNPKKNIFTVRALIGKTPSGAISFISDMWPGSISDKDLFLKSELLDYLEEGDLVLADRGFDIKELLEQKGCYLATQRFLFDRIPFSNEEKMIYPGKTHHRIHYDLASSRINKYKFFESQFTSMTFDIVNEYLYIIAFLVNFGNPLLNIKQH